MRCRVESDSASELLRCGVNTSASRIQTADRMADGAAAWLAALDDEQRAAANFAFDGEDERRNWGYFPRDFHGLPLLKMSARQQKLAHQLVISGLSLQGYARVASIIALENILDEIEERARSGARDPGRYFVSVFGAPGDARWGWRFEGHHVSLNFTIAGGAIVSPTPIFFGANPSEVEHGDRPVIRPCGEEEDLGRELLLSLDADQRRLATISPVAPPDMVLMNEPLVPETRLPGDVRPMQQMRYDDLTPEQLEALRFERARPKGIAASSMTPAQRAIMSALIDVYVDRLPPDLVAIERARIDDDGLDAMTFAWAGSERRREGHYYRLQATRFLVEYDNTQDGANHIHAVWRDPAGDFGDDILRRHLRDAHT